MSREVLDALYADVPFEMPDEPTPKASVRRLLGLRGRTATASTPGTNSSPIASSSLWEHSSVRSAPPTNRCTAIPLSGGKPCQLTWLASLSKLTDYSSGMCSWHNSGEKLRQTFARFALPMVWDFCEVNPLSDTTGGFKGMSDWVARYIDHALPAVAQAPLPEVEARSAIAEQPQNLDLICTDPPYYDAIPYSDLMDLFHIWLRRTLHGISPEFDAVFAGTVGPEVVVRCRRRGAH